MFHMTNNLSNRELVSSNKFLPCLKTAIAFQATTACPEVVLTVIAQEKEKKPKLFPQRINHALYKLWLLTLNVQWDPAISLEAVSAPIPARMKIQSWKGSPKHTPQRLLHPSNHSFKWRKYIIWIHNDLATAMICFGCDLIISPTWSHFGRSPSQKSHS